MKFNYIDFTNIFNVLNSDSENINTQKKVYSFKHFEYLFKLKMLCTWYLHRFNAYIFI